MTTSHQEIYLYEPSIKLPSALNIYHCFPGNYYLGMSALGYISLFKSLDNIEYIYPHRVFLDSKKVIPQSDSLVGFSFSFELDYINIFKMLNNMNIPILKTMRGEYTPLVFAGGPVVSTNPEPFVDFIDFFVIGDGDALFKEIAEILYKNSDVTRLEKLELLANIDGIYVPEFYDVEYNEDDTISYIKPNNQNAKSNINKVVFSSIDNCLYTPILTENTIFSNTFLIEIERGCSQKCFFCIASFLNLPIRYPSKESIIESIDIALQHTRNLGLLGALITEHPDLSKILKYIHLKHKEKPIKLTTSSLRADQLNNELASILSDCNQKQVTISLEAGSESLRNVINKKLSDIDIFNCLEICQANNINTVKMYGMIGLPGESNDDVQSFVDIIKLIIRKYPKLKVILSLNSFVAKAHTPYERVNLPDSNECNSKMNYIRKELLKYAKVRISSTKWDRIQSIISRGDRRIGQTIFKSYEYGGTLGSYNRAFKEHKTLHPSASWYANRKREQDEILPWSHIVFK